VNLENLFVEDSYLGPKFEDTDEITTQWVIDLMDWCKNGKVLHKKYATKLIIACRNLFEKDKSLVRISVPDDKEITVCGDVHG
jgi:serine/threonine-protein phosphatase 5